MALHKTFGCRPTVLGGVIAAYDQLETLDKDEFLHIHIGMYL
jgi:hypothetical protein